MYSVFATEFRGRGDEIKVHPLSFAEYIGICNKDKQNANGDSPHPPYTKIQDDTGGGVYFVSAETSIQRAWAESSRREMRRV